MPSASLDTSVSNANLQITGFVGNVTSYGLGSVMPYSGLINVVSARNTVSVGDRVPIFTIKQFGGSNVAWDTGATLAIGSSTAFGDTLGAAVDLMLSYANGSGQYSQPRVVSFVSDSATTGRVGINVAAPTAALDVAGNVVLNGAITQNLASYTGLNTSQIGYQQTITTNNNISNASVYTAIGNTGLLPPGVWAVEGFSEFLTNSTLHFRVYSLSTAGETTQDTKRKVFITCNANVQNVISINSIFVLSTSQTIYYMGYTNNGTLSNSSHTLRWTRIG
jgi:hypothetical protein